MSVPSTPTSTPEGLGSVSGSGNEDALCRYEFAIQGGGTTLPEYAIDYFAAWEQLQPFSEEVRAAFRSLR